jgi:hypothetical protein
MSRRSINADELHTLFTLIGQGIWHLQTVEDALHNTITLKRNVITPGSITQEEAKTLLAQHRRKTLGQSLRISREAQTLSTDLQKRLEHFKEERDWLVHRSVHQNGDDLYVDEKRVALMNRIKSFSKEAKTLQKLIASELEDFVVFHGVSREMIGQEAAEAVRKLRGE